MTTLNILQHKFRMAIFADEPVEVLEFIKPNTNNSAAEQFQVYRNNIFSQLTKALKNIYPVCCRLVGEDFFNALARHYILQNPSIFVDLNEYGEFFSEGALTFQAAVLLPYLADVARLEWAWHRLHNAADEDVASFKNLSGQAAPEEVIFLLPAAATLMMSPYPVLDIWEINRQSSVDDIVLQPEETFHYLLWRQQMEPCVAVLSPLDFNILSDIQSGKTLDAVCASHPAADLENLFPHYILNGWIVGHQ